MLKFILPKQEDFFQFFSATAEKLVAVALEFELLLKHLSDPFPHLQMMEEYEISAHRLTETTLEKLHKTFITPFDRYDIHRFVKKLDKVIDAIHRTGHRVVIYKLSEVPKEIHSMASLCVRSTEVIQSATKQLHSLKNATSILELCDIVNHNEGEADRLLSSGVSQLFQTESDLRQLLKIKEIYEYSKASINGCQTVANIIKDIVLEYS